MDQDVIHRYLVVLLLGVDLQHFALGLVDLRGEFLLRDAEFHGFDVPEFEGLNEVGLGDFVARAFDHDHFFFRADIDEIQIALSALCVRGVRDELSADATDAHGADGARERDVGNHECGARAVDREHVGVVLTVRAHERADDLRVVEVALREERAQRAIRHARGEDFLLGGTAFALEVAAGEPADCRRLFAVFDAQREPVLALFDLRRGDRGDEDDGFAATHGHGSVGELRELAGFYDDGGAAGIGSHILDAHFVF